jgi:hypothetical protein
MHACMLAYFPPPAKYKNMWRSLIHHMHACMHEDAVDIVFLIAENDPYASPRFFTEQ